MQIEEKTITQLRKALFKGELTAEQLIKKYSDRISRYDHSDNGLNSVLEINPDALKLSKQLDQNPIPNHTKSQLHGIPILLKDNINTADKMHTSAGSLALETNIAPKDAFIVQKLRNAGAVILGKTNMTEFANYMSDDMPGGFSSRGGQVTCPYNPKEDPLGSSTGSAVAVSSNFCSAALGTETVGSIISPSIINGAVGLKPTIGLLSRNGIIPISRTMDTAGPITRTVEDSAIMLSIIAGSDPADPITQNKDRPSPDSYIKALKRKTLRGLRIGMNRSYEKYIHEDTKKANQKVLQALQEAGAIIIDNLEIYNFSGCSEILHGEFKECINKYLSELSDDFQLKTLDDIIRFNKAHPLQALRYGQNKLIEANRVSVDFLKNEYHEALEARLTAIRNLNDIMDFHNLDIIYNSTSSNYAAFTGFPAMTIPIAKTTDGLSIGSFWVGRQFGEATLLQATNIVEKILQARLVPKLPK